MNVLPELSLRVEPLADACWNLHADGALTLDTIASADALLRRQIRSPRRISLHLAGVERCDSAAVAWLIALQDRALSEGFTLELATRSDAVQGWLDLSRTAALFPQGASA